MKITIAVILILFIPVGVSITSADLPEIPGLIGNWTGTFVGHERSGGYHDSSEWTITISITEQKDRVFNGKIFLQKKTGMQIIQSIDFSGAIGSDMKTFYLTEYSGGFAFGTIINPDTLEYIYAIDGENGSIAIDTFTRES